MAASLIEVVRSRYTIQTTGAHLTNSRAGLFELNLKPACLKSPHGTTWRQFGSKKPRPKSMTALLRRATTGDEVRGLLRAHVNDPRHLRLLPELPNAGTGVPDCAKSATGAGASNGDGRGNMPSGSLDPFSAMGQGAGATSATGSMSLPDLSDIVLPPKLTEEEAANWDGQPLPVEPKKGPWLARRGFTTPYDPVVAFNHGLQKLGVLEGGHAAREMLRALQANEIGPGIVPDAFTYTAVMHALVKSGDCTAALDVWRELLASGVRPTVPACGAALNAMAKNGASRWDLALSTVRSMKLRYGAEPNVQCFAAALSACAQAGEAGPALELLHEMETYYRVTPNAQCFSAVIAACARRAHLQRVLTDKAASSDFAAAPMSEALSTGAGRSAWGSGASSRGMGQRPGTPTTRTRAGVRGVAGEGEPGWRTAVGLLRRLEDGDDRQESSEGDNKQLSLSSMLLRSSDRSDGDSQNDVSSSSSSSSSSHQRRRPNPVRNEHAISATASACAASGRWQEALALVGFFIDFKGSLPPSPSSAVGSDVASPTDAQRDNDELKWLWKRAERERNFIKHRRSSHNQAKSNENVNVTTQPSKNQTSAAMLGLGRGVGVVACNAALHACALARRPAEAWKLLDKMQAAGLTPDAVSYTAAIHACSAHHCPSSSSSSSSISHAKRTTGRHKLALELLQRMENNGVPPNGCTATAAAHACVTSGQWRTALALLRDAEKSGLLSGQEYSLVAATIGMRAWLASGDSEGAEEALSILSDLMRQKEEARASRKNGSNNTRSAASDLEEDNDEIGDDFFDDIDDDFLDGGDDFKDETGADGTNSEDAAVGPDLLCYQTGLEACAMLGRPDRALALVDVMLDQGPAPDVRCFNTVLAAIASAAAKDGRRGSHEDRSDLAEEALNQSYESDVWSILNQIMPLHGVVPDRVGLNSGLTAFARRGMASPAVALFAEHFHLSPDPLDYMKADKASTDGLRATFVGGKKPAPDSATYAAILWSLANAFAPPPWTAPDAPPLKCLSSNRDSKSMLTLDATKSIKEEEVTELCSDPLWLLRRGLMAGTTSAITVNYKGYRANRQNNRGDPEDHTLKLAPVYYDVPLLNAALQALVRQQRRHRDALDLLHAVLNSCCQLSAPLSTTTVEGAAAVSSLVERNSLHPNVAKLLAAMQPSSASTVQSQSNLTGWSSYRSSNPDVATTASLLRRSLDELPQSNKRGAAETDAVAAAYVRRVTNRTTFNTAIDAAAATGDARAALALLEYLEKEAMLQQHGGRTARADLHGIADDDDFEKRLAPDDFSYGRTLTACCLRASGADPGGGSQSVDTSTNSRADGSDNEGEVGSGNILYLFPASPKERHLLLESAVDVLRRMVNQGGTPSAIRSNGEHGDDDEDGRNDGAGGDMEMHGHGFREAFTKLWQAVERGRGVVGEHKCNILHSAIQSIASEYDVNIQDDGDDDSRGRIYPR